MPTIFISGASSGLGLAFLKALSDNPHNTLITCDQHPLPLSNAPVQITHHVLDVTHSAQLLEFTQKLESADPPIPIHLVLHCIGVRGLVPEVERKYPRDVARAEALEAMDLEVLESAFRVNAAAAFVLLRALVPGLKAAAAAAAGGAGAGADAGGAGAPASASSHSSTAATASAAGSGGQAKQQQQQQQQQQQRHPPKVVVLTSRMGSVSANASGGAYAYRASKAALNALVKSFSVDVPEAVWVLCHPGRVESKLVGFREEGAVSAEESVAGILRLLEGWGSGDTGRFYDRFGERIGW